MLQDSHPSLLDGLRGQFRAKVVSVQVVSVSSLKGGVGKTTITLGLASAAYASGLRTLIIDMDPQSDVSAALASRSTHGYTLDTILKSPTKKNMKLAIAPSSWTAQGDSAVDVLMGSQESSQHDVPQPTRNALWRLEEALVLIESRYDLVLIDCPPSFNALTQTAWTASDAVAIVAEPGLFSVTAVHRTLNAIQSIRLSMSPRLRTAGVVINRHRPDSREHQFRLGEMDQLFGDHILTPIIDETLTMQQATGAATPIHRWPGENSQILAQKFDLILRQILSDSRS